MVAGARWAYVAHGLLVQNHTDEVAGCCTDVDHQYQQQQQQQQWTICGDILETREYFWANFSYLFIRNFSAYKQPKIFCKIFTFCEISRFSCCVFVSEAPCIRHVRSVYFCRCYRVTLPWRWKLTLLELSRIACFTRSTSRDTKTSGIRLTLDAICRRFHSSTFFFSSVFRFAFFNFFFSFTEIFWPSTKSTFTDPQFPS